MDKGEDIIEFSVLILSMIKRIYFVEGKKLKLSTDKSYRGEKKFLEKVGVIFTEIIKMYILVLIKNLIISGIILFK